MSTNRFVAALAGKAASTPASQPPCAAEAADAPEDTPLPAANTGFAADALAPAHTTSAHNPSDDTLSPLPKDAAIVDISVVDPWCGCARVRCCSRPRRRGGLRRRDRSGGLALWLGERFGGSLC